MKKNLFKKTLWTLCFIFVGFTVFLSFDMFYGGHNHRTMQDKIAGTEDVNLTGLREIKASGGAFPRFPYLAWKLGHIKDDIIILDVKGEFHGYIRGFPTSQLGYNRREPGWRHIPRRLILTGTTAYRPDLVTPEEVEAKNYGFQYKNFDIGSKFIATPAQIDDLIAFFDNLPHDKWVHIHCSHGSGRTSTALVMLDTLRNAPGVSLKDIVKRQHLLGSVDIFDTSVWPNGTYTAEELQTRKKFVEDFYDFVVQRKEGGIQLWSQWIAQNNKS